MIVFSKHELFHIPGPETIERIEQVLNIRPPCLNCIVFPVCDDPCEKIKVFFKDHFDLLCKYAMHNTKRMEKERRELMVEIEEEI